MPNLLDRLALEDRDGDDGHRAAERNDAGGQHSPPDGAIGEDAAVHHQQGHLDQRAGD